MMFVSRRARLIWHGVLLMPLSGLTLDIVTDEIARWFGLNVLWPWLGTYIGLACLVIAVAVRSTFIPHFPRELGDPDERLTRRSRILSERLGARAVRVFVCDMPLDRRKLDSFLDGTDLIISNRFATLPPDEVDFGLARRLAESGPFSKVRGIRKVILIGFIGFVISVVAVTLVLLRVLSGHARQEVLMATLIFTFAVNVVTPVFDWWWAKNRGPEEDRTPSILALKATGNLQAALALLDALVVTAADRRSADSEARVLREWWSSGGEMTSRSSTWYVQVAEPESEMGKRN